MSVQRKSGGGLTGVVGTILQNQGQKVRFLIQYVSEDGVVMTMRKWMIIPVAMIGLLACGCSGMGTGGIIDWTGEVVKPDAGPNAEEDDMTPMPFVEVKVGDSFFMIDLEDNSSAKAFLEKISKDELVVDMHDYGGFEKVGDLPWELPTNDEEITTKPGDIILYQGNKITIYYDENTWNFTKLGELSGGTDEDIAEWKEVFGGKDDIKAEFFVEWTE